MEKLLDLSWGDPFFLLELLETLHKPKFSTVNDLTYAPDAGMEELIAQVKSLTYKTTGNHYKHFLITNGATQAINIIMKVWKKERKISSVITSELGYPYYPEMIRKVGLDHIQDSHLIYPQHKTYDTNMFIIDSPSNPLGKQISGNKKKNTIWDAVYHNPIYNANKLIKPSHDVYVSSLSKLMGVTGARIGWIATNNMAEYNSFLNESLYDIATVSKPSQKLAIELLSNINMDTFMDFGKILLDNNREILQKISSLTDTDVQEVGMFYTFEADGSLKKVFKKANINFVEVNDRNHDYIRLNLGQTASVLIESVKRITKADRRK